MSNKEAVEQLLYDFPKIKSRIKILLANFIPEYSLKAVNYDRVVISNTNAIYSDIESYVIKKLDDQHELVKLIRKRDIIQSALECLTTKERRIISCKYFENMSDIETAMKFRCSERTIRNIRDEAIEKLEGVGILEAKK